MIIHVRKMGSYSRYRCYCGKLFTARTYSVNTGHTKSCGCRRYQRGLETRVKHGDNPRYGQCSAEYNSWNCMKSRCKYGYACNYKWYGGRGIKVCKRWVHSYSNFLKDMGRKPSPEYTLDRVNANGNYTPSNCRWSSPVVQARNKRRNYNV